MRIRAAVVEHKGAAFTFEDLELDEPNANEVLVRIVAVGICQTDIHMQHQEYPVPMPIVLCQRRRHRRAYRFRGEGDRTWRQGGVVVPAVLHKLIRFYDFVQINEAIEDVRKGHRSRRS